MDETQGFSVLGAFKLDHLQPVELILSHNFFDLYTGESNSLLLQRVEMRKRDSPKNGRDTEGSVLGAFKLDNLQPVELILSHNVSIILIFILGSPIPYYPREWKLEKEFTQKWMSHWGFCTWGCQTGPFSAC